jgi:hypothetical protein
METGNVEKAILARLNQPDSVLMQRVMRNNQILLHNFKAEVAKDCRCPLQGCERMFGVTLIPNQVLYPRYCEEHRNEFRREFHLEKVRSLRQAQQPVHSFVDSFATEILPEAWKRAASMFSELSDLS